MDPTCHITIGESLKRLVRGEISLSDFEAWFGPILWSIESSDNPAAVDLAYEIAGQLAEYGRGHWTRDDLIAHLAELAERCTPAVALHPREDHGASASEVVHATIAHPAVPV